MSYRGFRQDVTLKRKTFKQEESKCDETSNGLLGSNSMREREKRVPCETVSNIGKEGIYLAASSERREDMRINSKRILFFVCCPRSENYCLLDGEEGVRTS